MNMYECTIVDANYVKTAGFAYAATVDVRATPEQIFECFADEHSWPIWAPPITKVEWTSPKPYGLGTTRTVTMVGIVGDETFIAWDYPKHMAFCFTHCSQSIVRSFAEDYVVTPLEGGLTRVQWTMAMTPQGFGKFSMAISRPFMRLSLQWMLNRFKKYTEKRFSA
jgi:hypothetical protein